MYVLGLNAGIHSQFNSGNPWVLQDILDEIRWSSGPGLARVSVRGSACTRTARGSGSSWDRAPPTPPTYAAWAPRAVARARSRQGRLSAECCALTHSVAYVEYTLSEDSAIRRWRKTVVQDAVCPDVNETSVV